MADGDSRFGIPLGVGRGDIILIWQIWAVVVCGRCHSGKGKGCGKLLVVETDRTVSGFQKANRVGSIVPTLAKNARMGHPQVSPIEEE